VFWSLDSCFLAGGGDFSAIKKAQRKLFAYRFGSLIIRKSFAGVLAGNKNLRRFQP
jgi:hypothetical protein